MKDATFCKRLRQFREARNLTQAALESAAGLPSTTVSHYEKGTRAPGLAALKALCAALECTATDLIGV